MSGWKPSWPAAAPASSGCAGDAVAGPLRIKAEDIGDLQVISACVQDAVVKLGDIAYVPRARQFVVLLNRYRWENATEPGDVRFADVVAGRAAPNPRERVRAGLTFGSVLRARRQGLSQAADQAATEQVLALLAIEAAPGGDGAATITLTFAGGAQVRLDVECVDVRLEDLGNPWPARRRPAHVVE